MESQEQKQLAKSEQTRIKLALTFEISDAELSHLTGLFRNLKIDENFSPGQKAINLVKFVKHAIDLKFDKKQIDENHEFVVHHGIPDIDTTKAKLVNGMFLTFMEFNPGIPGFFSIISGIGSAGFGFGKFTIDGLPEKLSLKELKSFKIDKSALLECQAKYFNRNLVPEILSKYPNVRIGVYCQITGCALIPFYAAALKKFDQDGNSDIHILQQAAEMVEKRFSPDSERLERFISQNLFKVIFEELFNYESTVYSIFESY
ncbi:MAG: hypothetical protein Kow0029_14500 [Candidatus Rifleibacteriota bacterium]